MKTTNYLLYKKNITPQLWAFLEQNNSLESFIRNATNPKAYGVLSINKELVINQLETAFSFEAVKNTHRWMDLNEEWKKIEPSISLSYKADNRTREIMHAKKIGVIISMVIFAISIMGVNTVANQYVNLICTAVAFTCMCSLFILLLTGHYPKEDTKEALFNTKSKESWMKQ